MKNPTEFLDQSLGIVVYDEQGNLLYCRQHLKKFPVHDLAAEIRGIQLETFTTFLLERFPNFASDDQQAQRGAELDGKAKAGWDAVDNGIKKHFWALEQAMLLPDLPLKN